VGDNKNKIMNNINKQKLDDTISKLSSIVNSGGKATGYDRFVLACLQELALILDTDPNPTKLETETTEDQQHENDAKAEAFERGDGYEEEEA
jgi:hypothetical protein